MRLVTEMSADFEKAAHGKIRNRHKYILRLNLREFLGLAATGAKP
jgi:hypothetical protein